MLKIIGLALLALLVWTLLVLLIWALCRAAGLADQESERQRLERIKEEKLRKQDPYWNLRN